MTRILPHLAAAFLSAAPIGFVVRPVAAPVAPLAVEQSAETCDEAFCSDVCPVPSCCDEACEATASR